MSAFGVCKYMSRLVPFCILLCLFISCVDETENDKKELDDIPVSKLSGKELAAMHCGRCHAFVNPELLTKAAWNSVLPSMGYRMGIYNGGSRPDSLFDEGISGSIVRAANIYPEKPSLAKEDWNKIEQYFLEHAPDTILPTVRKTNIRIGLPHFKYRETSFSHKPALTTMVKILPDNRGIVYSDGKTRRNILTFLTSALQENYSIPLESTPTSFYEKS
ncbi:MAG: hypothetical protein ABI687_11615, partial [Flavitalea sp.]